MGGWRGWRGWRGAQTAARWSDRSQKIHQQENLAAESPRSPSLKSVFPAFTESASHCKFSVTVGADSQGPVHLEHAGLYSGMDIGI